ncbi:hypothetical protein OS21_16860 [Dickeya oryzae]
MIPASHNRFNIVNLQIPYHSQVTDFYRVERQSGTTTIPWCAIMVHGSLQQGQAPTGSAAFSR